MALIIDIILFIYMIDFYNASINNVISGACFRSSQRTVQQGQSAWGLSVVRVGYDRCGINNSHRLLTSDFMHSTFMTVIVELFVSDIAFCITIEKHFSVEK